MTIHTEQINPIESALAGKPVESATEVPSIVLYSPPKLLSL